MKRKILIPILVFLLLVIGIIGIIIFNSRTVSTITLDINPSIEIKINKDEKVIRVNALNNDAKVLISSDYKNKNIDEVLMEISEKIIDKIDNEGKEYVLLLHIDGKLSEDKVSEKLISLFDERHMPVNVIVPKITKKDEKMAKKLGITPVKVAYLSEVIKSNSGLKIEDIKNKPVSELKEMKESGRYCDLGYTLDGDTCVREIGKQAAISGEVCPNGYYDYNGTCYEETPSYETDKLSCRNEFTLEGNKCIRMITMNAEGDYTCDKGELEIDPSRVGKGIETPTCVDKSKAQKPKLRCLYNPGHIMIDGKCYNGPAPLINGGCPGADRVINGGCYSLDDEDQWQCPDGSILEKSKGTYEELCKDTFTYSNPKIVGYHCASSDFTLKNDKCIKEEREPAEHEYKCKSNYTLVNHDRCINKNKTANKEFGYICDMPDSKLKGNECILLERVEAKHN